MMPALDLVNLPDLMRRTRGSPFIRVGLIDGPVAIEHPALARQRIESATSHGSLACVLSQSIACLHGTFVASLLVGNGEGLSGICPGCTLVVRPIFHEAPASFRSPAASANDLAQAIREISRADIGVLNLSVALGAATTTEQRALQQALDECVKREIPVVAAAGNQRVIGSSVLTRHVGVTPVAACDVQGAILDQSNLAPSFARRGLRAPGEGVRGANPGSGQGLALSGTSVAAPFVTGTIALLRSEFPTASARAVRDALFAAASSASPKSVVPPLLNAWGAWRTLRG